MAHQIEITDEGVSAYAQASTGSESKSCHKEYGWAVVHNDVLKISSDLFMPLNPTPGKWDSGDNIKLITFHKGSGGWMSIDPEDAIALGRALILAGGKARIAERKA